MFSVSHKLDFTQNVLAFVAMASLRTGAKLLFKSCRLANFIIYNDIAIDIQMMVVRCD